SDVCSSDLAAELLGTRQRGVGHLAGEVRRGTLACCGERGPVPGVDDPLRLTYLLVALSTPVQCSTPGVRDLAAVLDPVGEHVGHQRLDVVPGGVGGA